ncbi:hypothetical protein SH611_18580 [Geminicoccaceae bacterium 1502E]|nr:hypothetical protein [Geminicoccaceae bacterium 1502E]
MAAGVSCVAKAEDKTEALALSWDDAKAFAERFAKCDGFYRAISIYGEYFDIGPAMREMYNNLANGSQMTARWFLAHHIRNLDKLNHSTQSMGDRERLRFAIIFESVIRGEGAEGIMDEITATRALCDDLGDVQAYVVNSLRDQMYGVEPQ